jgi:hypothetical protein
VLDDLETEISNRPDSPGQVFFAPRHPGRVVAAVLEPPESLEAQRLTRSAADITNDAARRCPFLETLV